MKKNILRHKQGRYLTVGGFVQLAEFILFNAVLKFSNLLLLSNSISFIFGIICGFILHKKWSFGGDHLYKTKQQLFGYFLLAAINFTISNMVIYVLVNNLFINPIVSKLIVMVMTAIWSFIILNGKIFKLKTAS